MYVLFGGDGKPVAWSEDKRLEADGYIKIPDEHADKLPFVSIINGEYFVDEASVLSQQNKVEREKIEAKLKELAFDINACLDGCVKSKTLEEYRRERIDYRNQLRILLGKEPLNKEEN